MAFLTPKLEVPVRVLLSVEANPRAGIQLMMTVSLRDDAVEFEASG